MTHGCQITRTNWRGITLETRFAPKPGRPLKPPGSKSLYSEWESGASKRTM